MQQIYPGIYTLTLGEPEAFTPLAFREYPPAEEALNAFAPTACPFSENEIAHWQSARGFTLELPLSGFEQIYGFGLQLKSFGQLGKKKTLRCNADPVANTGDSHAPVPFYVSTEGYGVFVDSARHMAFHCGGNEKTDHSPRTMAIDIPAARGVAIYIFAGEDMLEAVRKYNLFSGGGAMPPLWGLGFWYRAYGQGKSDAIEGFARNFRERQLPVTVLGLEPGWHTAAYSCSYVWNKENYPDHAGFVERMRALGYQLNLWEHAFVHPKAPFYDEIAPYCGDYEVFNQGLTPDFSLKEARGLFADYHRKEFAEQGVSGFKLDECDGSDYTGGWSYPNFARFPSGLDGEQMHSLIGLLYQHTVAQAFKTTGKRTWGLVRASGALAGPSPFALYSDLYDHRDFIHGLVNMGFTGLLWCPEIRAAASVEDLVRRVQMNVFAPLAMVNAWHFPNPPWWQVNDALNHQGVFMDNTGEAESHVRTWFELRMRLLPVLYTAFHRYAVEGLPPVRALVLDDPEDEDCWAADNAVIVGDSLYFAPMTASEKEKTFYLPKGQWVNFFNEAQLLEGGREYTFTYDLGSFPLYVRAGTLLPLARPEQFVPEHPKLTLEPKYYGPAPGGEVSATLHEDDGASDGGACNKVTLTRRADGSFSLAREGNCGHVMYYL